MKAVILRDALEAGKHAAAFIAEQARFSVQARGLFTLALSGGRTPQPLFAALADEDLPWHAVHLFQVDERFAPVDHPNRNLTLIERTLLANSRIPADHLHGMPVETADPDAAAASYAATLESLAGRPAVLDLVQLGLGVDGRTASLVPGDPCLDLRNADVAVCGPYAGRRRMTLTLPMLERARCILWFITGEDRSEVLARLVGADTSIPGGRVPQQRAVLFADIAAAPFMQSAGPRS